MVHFGQFSLCGWWASYCCPHARCCPGALLRFESPLVLQFLPPLWGTPAWLRCPADRIQLFGRICPSFKAFLSSMDCLPSLSHVRLFAVPWAAAHQSSLSFTISQSSLNLMSIELVMPSKPSHPLSPPSPPALSLSQHQSLFQWVGSSHQVDKVLEH